MDALKVSVAVLPAVWSLHRPPVTQRLVLLRCTVLSFILKVMYLSQVID